MVDAPVQLKLARRQQAGEVAGAVETLRRAAGQREGAEGGVGLVAAVEVSLGESVAADEQVADRARRREN